MIYTPKIRKAMRFAIKTHEVYQKQMRKGKDIAYITHPLTVGIILARAGADEDVVAAGILHDTIEDSIENKKVTSDLLTERFGAQVAGLVLSVTETDKNLSWDERKQEALDHVKDFSHESLLVKAADTISNLSEILQDYGSDGEQIFTRFNASKEKIIENKFKMISAIVNKWPENPLAEDLLYLSKELKTIK